VCYLPSRRNGPHLDVLSRVSSRPGSVALEVVLNSLAAFKAFAVGDYMYDIDRETLKPVSLHPLVIG
jgi:hypothetical protein